ncbi:MAG TPA: Gfo/Idh/MocA family oxidoreductase [Opitutaceae bacterium]|nr:Gfo/Idh/MocA family oxidoreductase [Opitutaceae bacterium]
MRTISPINVGLVGCGAVAELYYARAFAVLAQSNVISVGALIDPDPERRAVLARFFPTAQPYPRLEDLPPETVTVAVIASPPRFHAAQAVQLFNDRCHVLCEKPLATTVVEAEAMLQAARTAQRTLAVGLFRRFFPALRAIGEFCTSRLFGRLQSFDVREGGPFNWPAATPSFFDRKQAGGGVLLDAGVHVLDLLLWWLGEPTHVAYADDAQGGLEATCRIELGYPAESIRGTVLLSRDWKTSNQWLLEFERATVLWRVGEANRLEIRPRGSADWLVSSLETESIRGRVPADSYPQAFTRQVRDFIESIRIGRPPRVPGEEGLRSLRLIESCYRRRTPLALESP